MIEIRITENLSNLRLTKALSKIMKDAPDSFFYKSFRMKGITLNGHRADGTERTAAGDVVRLFFSEEVFRNMGGVIDGRTAVFTPPADFPEITVLYEDVDVCIFVKPAGVLSQKATESDYSVNEWAVYEALAKGFLMTEELRVFRPAVVNRLDRNTHGIMAAGFSLKGLQALSALFRTHDLSKDYYAIVSGSVTAPQDASAYLLKDEAQNTVKISTKSAPGAKPIRTAYEPVKRAENGQISLLRVHLYTGRAHQIRAHLSFLGHPVLGDMKYGDRSLNRKYGAEVQFLAACRLEFPEVPELPAISGKIFEIPVPENWPLKP